MLDFLQGPEFTVNVSPLSSLRKALFLVALASGLCVSQLRALTRYLQWTTFAMDRSAVSLASSPRFLAKNEREDHLLQPVVIPAWMDGRFHHSLCPVQALESYLSSSPSQELRHLFRFPDSARPLSVRQIAATLKDVIDLADPGHLPRAHDIRGVAASLAFLRTHSLNQVRQGGQWSTASAFVSRYLHPSVVDAPCVALGVRPNQ